MNKNPKLYFNRVEKAMKGLTRCEITSDLNEQRDMALYYLKAAGEFDAACREWEAKPTANKTWQNTNTFVSAEYAKENKQNKLTAKHFKVNMMEEQAEATEELIATLTEMHSCQIETLIKSTTNAMKEMMLLIKENKNPTNSNKTTNEERKKKREENQNTYNNAPICKNCGKKHPSKAEDECWELEKNKAFCPSMWKSTKSTLRCTGSKVETETWQPGVIQDITSHNHTHLVATNYWAPLYENNNKSNKEEEEVNMVQSIPVKAEKKSNKWAWCID